MPEETSDVTTDPIARNTETMMAVNSLEQGVVRGRLHAVERLTDLIGSPFCLYATLCAISAWVVFNLGALVYYRKAFDLPPFPALQGLVGCAALLVTLVVLIKQNRSAKLEERSVHLEMQLIMLTEQKVTKMITLIEELRIDLPMIKDRHDSQSAAFQVPTDPMSVLKTLDEMLKP